MPTQPPPLQVMFAEPMNLRVMGQKPSPPEAARMHLAASQESEEVVQQHTGSMSGANSVLLVVEKCSRKAQHLFCFILKSRQLQVRLSAAAAHEAHVATPAQSHVPDALLSC